MGLGLPDKDKTWQFYVNKGRRFTGSSTTDAKYYFLGMKIGFTGFGQSPWTVEYSSDGSIAGTPGDGVDRWGSDPDDVSGIVHSSGNRSWIVLKQTGIASNFQICIDLRAGSSQDMDWIYSYSAGFTGGLINARPTATDEIVLTEDNSFFTNDTTGNDNYHIMMSTDGEVTRMFMTGGNGIPYGLISFEVPKFPPVEWTTPHVCLNTFTNSTTAIRVDHAVLCQGSQTVNDGGSWTAFTEPLTGVWTKYQLYLCTEGMRNIMVGINTDTAGMNHISKKYEMYPAGVLGTTAPFRGRHATLYDLWFICRGLRTGLTIPATGKEFIVFGEIVVPWDGTTVPNISE